MKHRTHTLPLLSVIALAVMPAIAAAATNSIVSDHLGPREMVTTAVAATPTPTLGVNTGSSIFGDTPKRETHLSAMKAQGFKELRVDASWGALEPNAPVNGVHTYKWAAYDNWVTALANKGLRWLPVLGYSAPWASSGPNGAAFYAPTRPAGYTAYAQMAGALAARYGQGGTFWTANPSLPAQPITHIQLWNEPNYDYFWKNPSYQAYGDLYAEAYAAIHAANPHTKAMMGPVLNEPTWMGQLASYVRNTKGIMPDEASVHSYSTSASGILSNTCSTNTQMKNAGVDVPFHITEYGDNAAFNGTSGDNAARERMYRELGSKFGAGQCGVSINAVYVWTGPSAFDIADANGVLNASGRGLVEGFRSASAPPTTPPPSSCSGLALLLGLCTATPPASTPPPPPATTPPPPTSPPASSCSGLAQILGWCK